MHHTCTIHVWCMYGAVWCMYGACMVHVWCISRIWGLSRDFVYGANRLQCNNNNSNNQHNGVVEVVSPIASNLNSKEPLAQAQQDDNVDIISHKTLSAGRFAEEINERMDVDKRL